MLFGVSDETGNLRNLFTYLIQNYEKKKNRILQSFQYGNRLLIFPLFRRMEIREIMSSNLVLLPYFCADLKLPKF